MNEQGESSNQQTFCRTPVAIASAAVVLALSACSGEPTEDVTDRAAAPATASPFAKLTDPTGCVIERITTADYDEYQVQGASADGKWLAMAASQEGPAENDTIYEAYEVDLATGERTDLSHILKNSGTYSPDNQFIVVAQATDDERTDIFEYERASGELRAVAAHENWDWLPSYSPDGKYILFNSYRVDGQSDVHLFERASGTLTRLTEDPRYDAHAQFSSDGKRILFHRHEGNREEGGYIFNLFVIDVATGEETRLTDGEVEKSYAAWAPDGRHIVYSSDIAGASGKHNLYVMSLDGGVTMRMTEGDWSDSYSFWSHDGDFIYFNSDRAGATDIYRMPMDGFQCVREGDQA